MTLSPSMIRQLVSIAVLVVAVPYVLNQVRKPTKWVGRFFLWTMNMSHSGLTDWGLAHVGIERDFTILDVGCGGGRTIQKMAALATAGRVLGVDYSPGSVDASRAQNPALVQAGRVEIRQASVSQLPFPDRMFDLVTAVETHYYWPDLPHDTREILRVVKPGGTLMIIAESYKGGRNGFVQHLAMMPLRAAHLSADEHRRLLEGAGFSDVQVFEHRDNGWICVLGRSPAGPRPAATTAGPAAPSSSGAA
jgi:SAM-dependent methyltransferase